jgi:hypothetical protein
MEKENWKMKYDAFQFEYETLFAAQGWGNCNQL